MTVHTFSPIGIRHYRRHPALQGFSAKGEFGGICHRIACDNKGAHWFNETNRRYYCGACAQTFNEVCKRNGQPPLCELHL